MCWIAAIDTTMEVLHLDRLSPFVDNWFRPVMKSNILHYSLTERASAPPIHHALEMLRSCPIVPTTTCSTSPAVQQYINLEPSRKPPLRFLFSCKTLHSAEAVSPLTIAFPSPRCKQPSHHRLLHSSFKVSSPNRNHSQNHILGRAKTLFKDNGEHVHDEPRHLQYW